MKIKYLILSPVLLISGYFLLAYLLPFYPTKPQTHEVKNKKVYLLYNQMHSDIVFNIKDLNLSLFPKFKNKKQGYLTFGWGDKETYLNTPTWQDINILTSLKALFLNTPSLMHVHYIADIAVYKNLKTIELSTKQKSHLRNSIIKSFNFQKQTYQGYGRDDIFYTAHGSYNLTNTCNTWTGDKLRESNISMSYWTPFSVNVTTVLP